MNTPTFDPSDFNKLRDYVISLYPDQPAPVCVPERLQREELSSLKRTIGSERFFFVVDMESFEITHVEGVQQWLNYYEKEFTLKKYWGLVHPGLQKLTHTVFVQMAEILCDGRFKLEFMVQRYSSMTAIRHSKGHYLLLKRTASVFQYDSENRLREYLNEFTIIGRYNGEPLAPSFFTNKGEPEKERGAIVMQQVIDSFLGLKIFSPNELQVARAIVYQPGCTQKDIALMFNKSPNTIDTYSKRFLRKAREYFHYDFLTVNDASSYLHKNGLL